MRGIMLMFRVYNKRIIVPTAPAETSNQDEGKTPLIIGLCVGFTALCLCIVLVTYRLFRKEQAKYPENQTKSDYIPTVAQTPVTPNSTDQSGQRHTFPSIGTEFDGVITHQQNGNATNSDIPQHIQNIMNNPNMFEVSQAKKRKPPKRNAGLDFYYTKVKGPYQQPGIHAAIPSGSVGSVESAPYGTNESQTNVGLEYYYNKQKEKGKHQPHLVPNMTGSSGIIEMEKMNGYNQNDNNGDKTDDEQRAEGEGNKLEVRHVKKMDSFEMNLTNNAVASDLLMDDIVDDMEADNQAPAQEEEDEDEDPEGDEDDEDVLDEDMGNYIQTPQ